MKSPHSRREPSRSARLSPVSSRRALRKYVLIGSAAVLVGGVPVAVLLTAGGSHRTGSEVAAPAHLHGQKPTHLHGQAKPARRQANAQAAKYKWANAPINGGGFVTGLVFNPTRKNLAYARTDIGGAYRWNAKTGSWVPLTDWIGESNSNLLGIESLATDPVNPNRLYLAAGTYTSPWAGNGAILRSTDQGAHFTTIPLPFKLGGNEDGRSMGERLAIDPNDNRVLYLGTRHDGLWRSADYGSTWRKVASFPVTGSTSSGVGVSFVAFGKGRGQGSTKTIYVGVADSGTNLYRSTDGGASWSAVPGQPTGLLPHHGVLASNGQLYLSYGDAPGPNGVTSGAVWRLTTGTGSWRNISPASDSSGYRYGYGGLAVDPRHPGTVMVATLDKWWPHDEIYRSTDQGTSWKAISPRAAYDNSAAPYVGRSIGHWIGTLAIDPFAPGHVIYGTGSGIRGSNDVTHADRGATTHWSVRAKGLEETAVLGLISIPGGAPVISALGDVGGFTHTNLRKEPPTNFTNPTFANTTGIDFAQKATKVVARVGTGNEAKGGHSTDGGHRWTPFTGTPHPGAQAGSIAVSADAATFVWTPSDDHAYYSRDRGATWNSSQGLPANPQVVTDRANPRVFYALARGTLYFSTDAGATFAPRATSLPDGTLKAVSGAQGDLWIAAGNSGLLHSTNGGATFSKLGTLTTARGIGFGKPASGARYQAIYITGTIGRVSGAFRSVDGGTTWLRITDDRHQFGYLGSAITGDPNTYGRVYMGSNGRGVLYGTLR